MAFRQPTFNLAAAAQGNKHLDDGLRSFHERITELEKRVGTVAVDTNKHAPIAPTPSLVKVQVVSPAVGMYVVKITNPEFSGKGNQPRTPLWHRVSYSPVPDFSKDVSREEPSTQTHFTIVDARTRLFFRVDTSADGVNWN